MKTIASSCLLFTQAHEVKLGCTEIPEPLPFEVLTETLYSSVSPGTELRVLAGLQARLGADSFPVIPGYTQVSRVLTPAHNSQLRPGQLVFHTGTRKASHTLAWGGHVARAVVPASEVIPLPSNVDPIDASLLKLAAIAHRGVSVVQPIPGERIAVVGLGPIGQFSARLFASSGADVIAADVSPKRIALAQAYGLDAVDVSEGLNKVVRRRWPRGADIVVDATGRPGALHESADLVRDRPWGEINVPGGTLVIQGSYSGDVAFPQDIAFQKEARILWPRDCLMKDLVAVLRLLESGRLRVRDLIGEPRPIAQAPETYAALQKPGCELLTACFDWSGA